MSVHLEKEFSRLRTLCASFDIDVNYRVVSACLEFARLLIDANRSINLTAISEARRLVIALFLDSLLFSREVKGLTTVLDLGTGAGFPAVPLALLHPTLEVTALDCREKKIRFIDKAKRELGMSNLNTIHARAENLKHRKWDAVFAKAFGPLHKTLSLALPLVSPRGRVSIACSKKTMDSQRSKLHTVLGSRTFKCWPYRLPDYDSEFLHFNIQSFS